MNIDKILNKKDTDIQYILNHGYMNSKTHFKTQAEAYDHLIEMSDDVFETSIYCFTLFFYDDDDCYNIIDIKKDNENFVKLLDIFWEV